MKIERFTDKAREAITDSSSLAQIHANSQIEIEHLLAALLEQEGGIVPQIIEKAGGNPALVGRKMKTAIERLPRVQGDGGSEAGISRNLRRLLEDACFG